VLRSGGETEYVLNDFKDALLSFKQFIGANQAAATPEFKTVIQYCIRLFSN
jgi:hypothetical protein